MLTGTPLELTPFNQGRNSLDGEAGDDTLAGGDLIALKKGRADDITVRGWTSGRLGITLDNTPLPTAPPTNVLVGGAEHAGQDRLLGSNGDDLLQGIDGNDLLISGAGTGGGDGDLVVACSSIDRLMLASESIVAWAGTRCLATFHDSTLVKTVNYGSFA